jgi:hypothetical protein
LSLVFVSNFAESVSDVEQVCCLPELSSKACFGETLVFFSDPAAYGFDIVSKYLAVFRVHGLQRQAVFLVHSDGRHHGCAMDSLDLRKDCCEGQQNLKWLSTTF